MLYNVGQARGPCQPYKKLALIFTVSHALPTNAKVLVTFFFANLGEKNLWTVPVYFQAPKKNWKKNYGCLGSPPFSAFLVTPALPYFQEKKGGMHGSLPPCPKINGILLKNKSLLSFNICFLLVLPSKSSSKTHLPSSLQWNYFKQQFIILNFYCPYNFQPSSAKYKDKLSRWHAQTYRKVQV